MAIHIEGNNGYALWNSEKKELIGLFDSCTTAVIYLYGRRDENAFTNLYKSALLKKWGLKNTLFPFRVVGRFLNPAQIEELGGHQYIIKNGYREPDTDTFLGMNSTPGDHKKRSRKKNL